MIEEDKWIDFNDIPCDSIQKDHLIKEILLKLVDQAGMKIQSKNYESFGSHGRVNFCTDYRIVDKDVISYMKSKKEHNG